MLDLFVDQPEATLKLVTSAVHRHSAFFKAISAPYPESTSLDPRIAANINVLPRDGYLERPGCLPVDVGTSGEILLKPEVRQVLPHALYSPQGIWSWTDGKVFEMTTESRLAVESNYTTTIRRARVCGREFYVVSKVHSASSKNDGFVIELALFKKQLRPIQGIYVPNMINIFSGPNSFEMVFEPPHYSFWIEASTDMPTVVKKQVVYALYEIHKQGVIHRDIQLRNILICGDGKIMFVGFHSGHTTSQNPAVSLRRATKKDMEMEMRRLLVMLDYPYARTLEKTRGLQGYLRMCHNSDEPRRAEMFGGNEPRLLGHTQDRLEAPYILPVVLDEWISTNAGPPRRFVMPGQTRQQLTVEIQSFLTIIDRWERTESAKIQTASADAARSFPEDPIELSSPSPNLKCAEAVEFFPLKSQDGTETIPEASSSKNILNEPRPSLWSSLSTIVPPLPERPIRNLAWGKPSTTTLPFTMPGRSKATLPLSLQRLASLLAQLKTKSRKRKRDEENGEIGDENSGQHSSSAADSDRFKWMDSKDLLTQNVSMRNSDLCLATSCRKHGRSS